MFFSQPVTEIIENRFSCRTYSEEPIDPHKSRSIQEYSRQLQEGPLGSKQRFGLISANGEDRDSLRGLGAYGVIKNPAGYLAGLMSPHPKNLEDFGYLFEKLILYSTDLGLGTCWIGGLFTKSGFAKRFHAGENERMPAIAAIGNIPDVNQARQAMLRKKVNADTRLPWEDLFFKEKFASPLSREEAGAYAAPLDMVRWGPSASNKQPWRIIRDAGAWHFFLQRTKGYHNFLLKSVLKVDDLQRIDMGIAMCHFELTAQEAGLPGRWIVQEPGIAKPDPSTEYIVTWKEN